MMVVHRYHDICAGHRVVGHEGKCRHLHGHNYRIHFYCASNGLDDLGRVFDFSEVKNRLCNWLEENWDHKFLVWEKDPLITTLHGLMNNGEYDRTGEREHFNQSLVWLPFNPTAENLADYLLNTIAPKRLEGTGVKLVAVHIEETRKCGAILTTEDAKVNQGLFHWGK